MKKSYTMLSFLMCFTSQIYAGNYAIQLIASKTPTLAPFLQLEKFGDLYTTDAGNGFIRTRLGPFSNKQTALETLAKVHAAGYPTAILAKESTNSSSSMMTENAGYTSSSYEMKNTKEWQMLTAEQQANVVTLDGTLHIKNGDNFTPLSEFVTQ